MDSRSSCVDDLETFPYARSITRSDGLQLRVWEWSRSGFPVVLLHGLGHNGRIWEPVVSSDKLNRRWLAVDLRGHGGSDWSRQRCYEVENHQRDFECIFRALNLDRIALVGHSLGAEVAARFAASHPDCVIRLSLVDPVLRFDRAIDDLIRSQIESTPDFFNSTTEYVEWLRGCYPAGLDEMLNHLGATGLRARSDGTLEVTYDRRCAREPGNERSKSDSLLRVLSRIRCQVQIVRGEASAVLRQSDAQSFVELNPMHAELSVIPRSGHSIIIDNPNGLSNALHRFLDPIKPPNYQ